jgi:signal transduction histidine kinase
MTQAPTVGMMPSPAPRPASEPSGEAFSVITSPALRAAAQTVASQWTDDRGDALDPREMIEALVTVARAVDQRLGPRPAGEAPPPPAIPSRATTALGRRLLDLLRGELVRRWSDPAGELDAAAALELMRATEAVRVASEPDWSRVATSRLAGPDGPELLVEVAHDLRSPLTSILFLAETLQRGQSGAVSELQRRQLGLIYGAALGLNSLASDLIELVRGGDRLPDQEQAPFSITEIFESVRDIVRPIAEEKRLTVKILPPASDHRRGHHLALSRVLLNLTTNALKFSEEGFVELVGRATDRFKVEFSVRDTGKGINPEYLGNLYQPFRRTGGRRGYYLSGTGLGLAISRRLVEAMGSELQVESRPDWGTRFHFELTLPPATQL